jgi:hypothetical protein
MHQLNKRVYGQLDLAIQCLKEITTQIYVAAISEQIGYGPNGLFKSAIVYSAWPRECELERLIQMMTVVDDVLVIEEKGIYSAENSNVKQVDVLAGLFTQNEFRELI